MKPAYRAYLQLKSASVSISDKDFYNEHANLLHVLQTKSKKDDRAEYAEQRKELVDEVGSKHGPIPPAWEKNAGRLSDLADRGLNWLAKNEGVQSLVERGAASFARNTPTSVHTAVAEHLAKNSPHVMEHVGRGLARGITPEQHAMLVDQLASHHPSVYEHIGRGLASVNPEQHHALAGMLAENHPEVFQRLGAGLAAGTKLEHMQALTAGLPLRAYESIGTGVSKEIGDRFNPLSFLTKRPATPDHMATAPKQLGDGLKKQSGEAFHERHGLPAPQKPEASGVHPGWVAAGTVGGAALGALAMRAHLGSAAAKTAPAAAPVAQKALPKYDWADMLDVATIPLFHA